MNITTLRHDPPEPPAEAGTFSTGAVFTVICGQVTGEVIVDVAHDGTMTYTVSMGRCGAREYQEDADRLRRIGAVTASLADELEARQAAG